MDDEWPWPASRLAAGQASRRRRGTRIYEGRPRLGRRGRQGGHTFFTLVVVARHVQREREGQAAAGGDGLPRLCALLYSPLLLSPFLGAARRELRTAGRCRRHATS